MIKSGESDTVGKAFMDFSQEIAQQFRRVDYAYIAPDEVILMKGIRGAAERAGLDITVRKAAESDIGERITLTNRLLTQNRLSIVEGCDPLTAALSQTGTAEKRKRAGRAKSRNEAVLRALLCSLGLLLKVEESQMSAVVDLSGSSPAYF